MISTLYNSANKKKYIASRQEAMQGSVRLRCCSHVKLTKKPGARSGFHRGIKQPGAAILRKEVVRATWLVVRQNAQNART